MPERIKFSPCMMRAIINHIVDNQDAIGEILEDDEMKLVRRPDEKETI